MTDSKPGPPHSTRAAIEDNFRIENGIIRSPGKFEGEALYAPYFYEAMMNGMSDDYVDNCDVFHVDAADIKEFPELEGVSYVRLWESNDGFVYVDIVMSPPA